MGEIRSAIILEDDRRNRWAVCPWCRKKGALIHPGARVHGIGLRCRKCGRDYLLEI